MNAFLNEAKRKRFLILITKADGSSSTSGMYWFDFDFDSIRSGRWIRSTTAENQWRGREDQGRRKKEIEREDPPVIRVSLALSALILLSGTPYLEPPMT